MSGWLRSGKLRATPEKDGVSLRNSGKKIVQKTLFDMMPRESGSVDDASSVSPSEAVGGRKGECDGTYMELVVCGLPSGPWKKRSRIGNGEGDEGPGTVIRKAKGEILHGEMGAVWALRPGNAVGNEAGEQDEKSVKSGGQNSSLGMKTMRSKEGESNGVAQELVKGIEKKKARRGRPPKRKWKKKVVQSEAEYGWQPEIQKDKEGVKTKATQVWPPKLKEEKEVLECEATEAVKSEENESNEVAGELMEEEEKNGNSQQPQQIGGENEVLKIVDTEAVKSKENESNEIAGELMVEKKNGNSQQPQQIGGENEVLKSVDTEAVKSKENDINKVAEGLMEHKKRKRGRPRKIREEDKVLESANVEEIKYEDDKSNVVSQGLMNRKKKKKGRRGQPRKIQGENEVLKITDVEAVNSVEGESNEVDGLKKQQKEKGKRRSPRKLQVRNVVLKSEAKDFCEGKSNGLARSQRGLGMKKGLKQRKSIRRAEMEKRLRGNNLYAVETVSPSSKRKHIDMEMSEIAYLPVQNLGEENSVSIDIQGCREEKKNKTENGENVLGRKMEKRLIRDRILKLLFRAGWTIDYRPRQGREYEDAVYVSPDGKTHWSITLAYKVLKTRYENGDVGNAYKEGFVFTPIPEEELKILTKVMVKKREGKKIDKCMEEKVKANRVPGKKKMKRKLGYSGGSGLSKLVKRRRHEPETMTDNSENEMPPSSGNCRRRRETQKRKRYALLVRNSGGTETDSEMYVLYNGKRTVLSWMIDLGIVPDQGKVQYMNQKKTQVMLEGRITKDGILCDCCNEVIGLTEFERHAGSESCLALENMHLENGNSFLQCVIESWNKHEPERNWWYFIDVQGDDPNDDTCGICGDGGNLVCCDSCPSTFHQSCLNIERFPSGDWNCVYCSCKFCGKFHETKSRRNDDGDVQESALLTCILCKAKYHSSCNELQAGLESLDKFPSFCGKSCQEIYERTQMLLGVKHEIAEGFTWTLLQRSDVADFMSSEVSRKVECNSKLAVALSVMDECFCPLTDHRSGINLIRNILYNCGSNFNRLDFSGFYTVILERGEEIISAASIRIHGSQLAEMPFIGTRYVYRRQGMCRRLLSAIESVLGSLNVEKLVIPAVSEVKETWTSVFDFVPVELSTKERMRSMNIMVFPGVDMLQKPLLDHHISHKNPNIAKGSKCSDVEDNKTMIDLNTIPEASADILHPINGQLAVVKPNSQLLDGSSNDISDITSASADCPGNDKCSVQLEIPSGIGENIKNVNGQHSISDNYKQIAKTDATKLGDRDVEADDGSYNHCNSVAKSSSSGDVCPVSGEMNGVEGSCDASIDQIEAVPLSLEAKRNAADVSVEELNSVQVDGTRFLDIIGQKSSCVQAQVSDKTICIACTDSEELANEKKSNGNMQQTTLSPAMRGGPHAKTLPIASDKSASEVCPSASACEIDVSTSKLPVTSDDSDLHHRCNGLDPTEKKADFASISSRLQTSLDDLSDAVMEPDLQSCASGHSQAEVALLGTYQQIEDINHGAKDGSTLRNQEPLAESGSNCPEPNPRLSSNSDTGPMVDHTSVPECIGESLCKPSLVHV